MATQMLRPELTALVHHIELDKAGWLDKAAKSLVTFAVWLNGNGLALDGVCDFLRDDLHIDLDQDRMRRLIAEMCEADDLIECHTGVYKIPECKIGEYQEQIENGQEVDNKARAAFNDALQHFCPSFSPDDAWSRFLDALLLPLVQELGARLYELIAGVRVDVAATSSFRGFLNGLPADVQPAMREVVIGFLSPGNPHVRSYVLRHLNAYFFLQSSSLSEEAVDSLVRATKKRPTFKLFLDTNFIFSVLGIHENPSNEAAQALLDLVARAHRGVEIILYVLPPTLDEARRVLATHRDMLRDLHLTRNLADGALETGLTGVFRKYAEECHSQGLSVSAEAYFDPYVNDLMSVLHSRGIRLYNDDVDSYGTRQDVIDDILDQQERQKTRPRPKTYADLRHDMVVWHFTHDRRPKNLESPLGAQYWVVTVDYGFLRFDAYKRKGESRDIPICLHPAALVQMLQLWVPRNEECDKAVLGTMRLPFLFQAFDPEAERATVAILRTLTRFENSSDLTPDTVHRLLMNKALRQRMQSASDVQEQIELVREALVEEDRLRSQQLSDATTRAALLQDEATAYQETSAQRLADLEEAKRLAEAAEQARDEERASREDLQKRLVELERQTSEREEREAREKCIRLFQRRAAGRFVLALFVAGVGAGVLLLCHCRNAVAGSLAVLGLTMSIWLYSVDRSGSANAVLRMWGPLALLHRFRIWVFGVLAAVMLCVVGNTVYDWLKAEGYF